MVCQQCEVPAIEELMELFDTENQRKHFFLDLSVVLLTHAEGSRGIRNRVLCALCRRVGCERALQSRLGRGRSNDARFGMNFAW